LGKSVVEYFSILESSANFEEARDRLLALLQEKPNDGGLLKMLGVVSGLLGQTAQAFRYYQTAIQANPQDGEAHFNVALLYLQHGNYPAGFTEYEWRRNRTHQQAPACAPDAALWDGRPLRDEPLVLRCEQGLGDNIQFIRFLPQVRERVAKIYLVCYPALHRLFSGLEGLAGIGPENESLPPCLFHASLASLPRIFKTSLETLPRTVPYLPVSPPTPRRSARPRVGLAWRANVASADGSYRSAPLAAFRPLADLPVDWISLQMELTDEEKYILRTDFKAEDKGNSFQDLKDTADVVETLDLVVTVDTSMVHLAGAMARPTWVLLPRSSDWRWLLDRRDSPWYPTATLIRQTKDSDWSGPVRAVRRGFDAALDRGNFRDPSL
jgi:tetratricopeptide (TPR) repeat protein